MSELWSQTPARWAVHYAATVLGASRYDVLMNNWKHHASYRTPEEAHREAASSRDLRAASPLLVLHMAGQTFGAVADTLLLALRPGTLPCRHTSPNRANLRRGPARIAATSNWAELIRSFTGPVQPWMGFRSTVDEAVLLGSPPPLPGKPFSLHRRASPSCQIASRHATEIAMFEALTTRTRIRRRG